MPVRNDRVADNPLAHLDYFAEWGGDRWASLLAYAFGDFVGPNLEEQHVLEIGTRYGKMAALFALLGATVTAVDLNPECLAAAQEEAEKWDVSHRTDFALYDGNLDIFCDEAFDLVFSKSVLVLVPHLAEFLEKIAAKLKPGGKIVFLENGRGSRLVHRLRAIRHRHWDYDRVTYFTPREIDLVRSIFNVQTVKYNWLPPIYLILGTKGREEVL